MTLQVFISYKSEYREFARAVKGQLNQWGFDTWLDVDNIQPGDYFRHKIQQGLDSSDVLLMVLTEEAQLSREVMSEVDYFLDVAKKPVVPLRHRECKPLYIFVSIQYIDFVTDQANGFVQLKQRLGELAASVTQDLPKTDEISIETERPGAPATPDAFGGSIDATPEKQASSSVSDGAVNKPKPEPAEFGGDRPALDEAEEEIDEKKKEILTDGLFDLPALEPASEAPKPQPAPASPPPRPQEQQSTSGAAISPPSSPITAPPVMQPQREAEYMPQPASVGRKSRSPILWPLAAVASLVIVVVAFALVSSNAALINTSQQPEGTSPLVWIGLLLAVGVVGVLGWRRFGLNKSIPDAQTDEANRATMLQNVEDFYVKSMKGVTIQSGVVLRHKDYGDYPIPANTDILSIFNDLNRELLILGAPGGSGKTMLLLQLAHKLIEQAKQDVNSTIPAVFNLSTWTTSRKPLSDWLVDEIRQKYQMPADVAQGWINAEKLLLLLDGLDEVNKPYQNECVEAINDFRHKYRAVDLAVCSRVSDYDLLTSKLDIRGAITIQ